MEPRIQYAKTSDGVNIAYWTMGQGEPALLCTSLIGFSNISLELERADIRGWYEHLAAHRMLVRFDHRNAGLSQRGVADTSLEAFVADLEAVVDRLSLDRFYLLACGITGPPAIAYAAKHNDKVSRIVLWAAPVHNRDGFGGAQRYDALVSLAERDWDLATETVARTIMGWSTESEKPVWGPHEWAEFIRRGIDQADFVRLLRVAKDFDLSASLPKITAATLVLQSPGWPENWPHAQIFASNMPNAELLHLSSGLRTSLVEHPEALRLVEQFFDIPPPATTADIPGGMTAILFADIADSTALTERLGDAAFRAKARHLDAALRTVIRTHAGTPIEGKLLGDGVLAVFTSARQAIEAALACARSGDEAALSLHLGLHAGDVIREDNNVYGGAVNIASRISGLSAPSEVLISDIVRGLARTSASVQLEDRGELELKGVGEAVRVWAVIQG
jgi:class 3 adenylate cyclase/pimeloyl-ACP methyl ester carboxylesterase